LSLGNGKDPFNVAMGCAHPGTDQNHEITASLESTLRLLRMG
jgi:hypothetical protein